MKITNRKSLLWVLALVAFAVGVWCLNHDRLSKKNWAVPVEYGFDTHFGDSQYALALMQAAGEGTFVPLMSKEATRLGAPYTANWNDFPLSDEFLFFFLGILVRVFGLFQATNLALVLGHVLSALAFYYCCRLLRYNRIWAWVGAILFAFTYYTSYRGLSHLTLGYIYTIPLAVVCSWIIAGSKRMEWGDKFCRLCLVVSAVIGVSLPYYLNMYCQLILGALVVQLLARRRKQNLWIGAASLAVAVVASWS